MNKGVDFDSFSAKSDDEHLAVRHERHNLYGKRMVQMSDGFESTDARSSSSSNRVDRRKVVAGRDENYNAGNWDVEVESFQEKISRGMPRVKISRDFDDMGMYDEDEYSRGLEILGDGRSTFQRTEHEVVRYKREIHDYESLERKRYNSEGPSNVGDHDRAEILKQIDALKDQLSRCGGYTEKNEEKIPLDRRMDYQDPRGSQNRYPDSHLGMSRPPMQYGNKDSQYTGRSYQNQYADPPYLMRRDEPGDNGFYPSRYTPSHIQGYDDPVRAHLSREAPYQNQPIYQHPSSYAYIPARYVNDDSVYRDNVEPYPCSYSRKNNRQVPSTAYSDKYYDTPTDKMSVCHDSLSSFGSQDHNRRIPSPPSSRPSDTPSHDRQPSDVKSDTSQLPQRVKLASNGQLRRSIAGGAPFVACHNCSEVLLLPKKVVKKNGIRKKVRCGACSTVIAFAVSNKKLVVSENLVVTNTLVGVNDERHVSSTHENGLMKHGRTDFASDDYDNSGCDFQSMDGERGNNNFLGTENRISASKYNYEREDVENLIASIHDPYADMEKEDKAPPPLAGSTLQDYFEYSNKYNRGTRPGDRNGSGLSNHSKEPSNKIVSRQQESSATEIDFSSNEYPNNTRSSFGSGTASMNGEYPRGGSSRTTASHLSGVEEKSPSGSDRYSDEKEIVTETVTVNGHLIPNELVMRAQKLAGRIRPGNYWYDFRAGFWGVMGGPCLGIIPPLIEEFNYPMPAHCAAGNTRVYVNGRELNQKDLNLLCSRGLPDDRDRSYIVEISGKVLNDSTGEELQSLGKLAPSVEKARHGFGMRPRKAA